MRIVSGLVSLMLLAVIIPINADASPAEVLEVGVVFGGQWVEANNSTIQNSQLADLPAIVEDYTATWCTNCVSFVVYSHSQCQRPKTGTQISLKVLSKRCTKHVFYRLVLASAPKMHTVFEFVSNVYLSATRV